MMESSCVPVSMNVVPEGSNGGNGNNGWGGDWVAWIALFLIFGMFGWGGYGGFGGMGGGNGVQGALTRGDLCMDMNFNDLQNAVGRLSDSTNANFRSVDNAVCTLGYNQAQLANGIQMQLSNGFGQLDTNLCQLGNNIQQGFNSTNVALLQGQNALTSQIANCCCENRQGQADIKYQMATDTCAINTTANMNTRDLIENSNANTRAILDKLTAQEIAAKDAQITAQSQQIFGLQLAASQAAQNQYLVNELRPCPQPAYLTCNPFTGQTHTGYSCNNGCGC